MGDIIKNLKKRYPLIDYGKPSSHSPTISLFMRWAYRVDKGWYGFDLEGTPYIWGSIIHDFLSYVESKCPDFKIHQIKLKWGGLRMYLSLNSQDESIVKEVQLKISELEEWLTHKNLIY
jgi:hypothetical protein